MNLTFSKSTDSEHKEKLESELVAAAWLSGSAPAGGTVKFEVVTEFVGNGAQIKVTGKSENGKKLGKIKDVIRNNKYIGTFSVPDDIELDDKVYFEVSLPKVGLSGESERIPAAPPIRVNNMKWSADEARRGDVLTLSAFIDGVNDETEVTLTIYEFDNDNAHDKIVALPGVVKDGRVEVKWEYEYHEDTDEIPTEEEMNKYGRHYNPPEYFFTITIGDDEFGKEQESGLLKFKDWIEIELKEQDGTPLGGQKYRVVLPDGTNKEGTLNDNGLARIENVPPGQCRVEFPDMPGTEHRGGI